MIELPGRPSSPLPPNARPNPKAHQTMEATVAMLRARGLSAPDAEQGAIALIGQTLQQQVGYLAYIDVFHTLALISLAVVPLALILRKIDLNHKGSGPAH